MAIQAQLFSENLDGFGLGAPQDLMVENGCGTAFDNLCFVPQQQQQQQQQPFDGFRKLSHQKNLNFFAGNNYNIPLITKNILNDQQQHQQSMVFSQSVSAQIKKQGMELDQFINIQNERLRLAMQQKRKQLMSQLLKKYESKTQFLLKQKQEAITKASNRAMELQDYLKRLEFDSQTWQRVARENEATAASLNGTIQRLREFASLRGNAADDAESCCQDREEERVREVEESERKKRKTMVVCKCCNSRNSCMVMLPCRHLCSCKDCEVFLDSCPVCRMAKKASIEAII